MQVAGHHYAEAPARHTWRDEGCCEGCAFEWDGIACIEAHPASRIAFGGDCLQRGVIYIAAPVLAPRLEGMLPELSALLASVKGAA